MNILNKTIVLVLNRNWQAINVRTPQEAFCMMATNVATALEIEFEEIRPLDAGLDQVQSPLPLPVGRGEGRGEGSASSLDTLHSTLEASSIRPATWDEWITLPIRPHDNAVQTVRGQIRVPTVTRRGYPPGQGRTSA